MVRATGGLVGVALLGAGALSGCSADVAACTEIGADSGVTVGLGDAGTPGTPVDVHACVGVVACEARRLGTGDPRLPISVEAPDLDGSPVRVTLRVVDRRDGTVLFRDALFVEPGVLQPNGPGCPPIAHQARVAAVGGRLVLR